MADWTAWRGPGQKPATAQVTNDDTPADMVFKLVEGNLASAEACIAMVKAVAEVDPKAEFGPFTPLLILDSIGLRGPAIGEVYAKVFDSDPGIALGMLHALRLKLVTKATMLKACDGEAKFDTTPFLALVRRKIPTFKG